MPTFLSEPNLGLMILTLLAAVVPPGNCDHVDRVMPPGFRQYPHQLVEPQLCRAQPRVDSKKGERHD